MRRSVVRASVLVGAAGLSLLLSFDRIQPPPRLATLHDDIRRLIVLRLDAYGLVIDSVRSTSLSVTGTIADCWPSVRRRTSFNSRALSLWPAVDEPGDCRWRDPVTFGPLASRTLPARPTIRFGRKRLRPSSSPWRHLPGVISLAAGSYSGNTLTRDWPEFRWRVSASM